MKIDVHFNDPSGIITDMINGKFHQYPELVDKAVRNGILEGSRVIEREMKDVLAERGRHNSRATRTQSPAYTGTPMMVTGALRRSVTKGNISKVGFADWKNYIGPGAGPGTTTPIHAYTQEHGAFITPKKARFLRFVYGKQMYVLSSVYVPPRPYVSPTVARSEKKAQDAFTAGMRQYLVRQWYSWS